MRRVLLPKAVVCALVAVACALGVMQFVSLSEAADGSSPAAAATKPLRWRVSHAAETVSGSGLTDFCMTMVVVMNTTNSSVAAELEWFSAPGTLLVTESFSLAALQVKYVGTDDEVLVGPFGLNVWSDQLDFTGFAHVYADDPRIIVSAYLICRDAVGATQNLTAMLPIPTFAVGDTLEYFQASAPSMGVMPPIAVPEGPGVQ